MPYPTTSLDLLVAYHDDYDDRCRAKWSLNLPKLGVQIVHAKLIFNISRMPPNKTFMGIGQLDHDDSCPCPGAKRKKAAFASSSY